MKLQDLEELIQNGESDTLEFKKTTASLDGAAQTLCGFLNGKGGHVLIGVSANGKLAGQSVTDCTLQEIARALAKFEPHAQIHIHRIAVEPNKEVIMLATPPADRTLRDDFQHLKRLGLIVIKGHGRGASWSLAPRSNKAE